MEQKNKEILDELVALLKQLKKDKIAGAPYISRFFNYLKQYSIQDMIDLVANEETRQSLVSLQEEHSPEIKGNECYNSLQEEYQSDCQKCISIDQIISALHNDEVINKIAPIIYDYLMHPNISKNIPVNPADDKATLDGSTKVDLITDESTEENAIIGLPTQQRIEKFIQTYYEDENACRNECIKLVLCDAENRAGHPQPFQSMEEAKKIPLQQTLGNAKLWAIQDDGNRYLVVPVKHMKLSYSAILKNGLDEFFEFESPDNLSGSYNSFTLKKPAVFEKRDDFYYVVDRGQIKVEN